MSEWLALVVAMLATCMVVILVAIVRQRRRSGGEAETPDVIEYMSMMIGVIYAVVLGLAIAGSWETRSAAKEAVRVEAQSMHEAGERAAVYPTTARDRVLGDIDTYIAFVVHQDWPQMEHHRDLSPTGEQLLGQVRSDVTPSSPNDLPGAAAAEPVLDAVATADDARSTRAAIATSEMPVVVWIGLFTGALITVALIFLLEIRSTFRELLLGGLFSALVVFLLFVVWDFQSPFGHSFGITPEAFTQLFPAAAHASGGGTG
ncbi:hypothetical protein ACFZB9_24885 [Kitasatospora sp. NPDC008050]|uniref:bestrophin-like domain n=1 Tax=Kitasatospora sp. NPDC008050 TaxID=3364021 RepID=UPI0036EDEA6C